MKINNFFFEEVDRIQDSDRAFLVQLPINLRSESQVLNAYYQLLQFPGYFGFNWDALLDSLCDLPWIDQHVIVVIHSELPKLSDEELRIYLNILANASLCYEERQKHSLQVVFPLADKARVMKLLKDINL